MKLSHIVLGAILLAAGFSSLVFAQANDQEVVSVSNKICPVSGQHIEGSGMGGATHEYKGKVYQLCCLGCISVFESDPDKYSKIAEEEADKNSSAVENQHSAHHM